MGRIRYWVDDHLGFVMCGFVALCLGGLGFVVWDQANGHPVYAYSGEVKDKYYEPSHTSHGTGIDSNGRLISTSSHESEKFIVFVQHGGSIERIKVQKAAFFSVEKGDRVRVYQIHGRFFTHGFMLERETSR